MSITAVLVAINLLIFIAMVVKGASVTQPTADQILRWGANFGPLTLTGQWWRLLTAMFVHIGLVHLALNMWCLWQLGLLAEYLYGRKTFLALYVMSGLAASIVSLARNPLVVTAGASGAIFGLAGALIATLYLGKLAAPKGAWRTSLISLVAFAGYNLAYGFVKAGIDNGAHIGGLLSGLLLGSVLSVDFRQPAPRQSRMRPMLFPAFVIVLVAGAVAVRFAHMPVVRLEHAEQQLRQGDNAGAVRELTEVVKLRPNYVPAWMLLGSAYLRTQQDSQAEAAFQRAAQLNPKNPAVLAQLGVLYLRDKRYEPARQAFQQITELNPKDVEAQVNLGVALNQLGRSDEALTQFRKATELNPNLPQAWYNLGLGSMKLQRYDDAVDAFTRATKLAPKDAEAWIWLANAYQAKGMTEQADQAYLTGYKLRAQTKRR
ncbi:MAG: rhomboid family intramembrane serine protease [Acidobacteriia bacterium]|nr:rhomboid family intramembrane serine protease [Terriglobia bacterium]